MSNSLKVSVEKQLAEDYLAYATKTLSRGLPGALDGLNLAQRRILQIAWSEGFKNAQPYKKSARLEGAVMGKLHPHGSSYGVSVNMALPSNPHHLLDFHGNIGGTNSEGLKISNDSCAASRYTELKLSKFAEAVYFNDESYKYAATRPSYDGSRNELLEFVPALPMALFTGNHGIVAGYASSMATYNLKEFAKTLAKRVQGKSAKDPCFDFVHGCKIVKGEGLATAMDGRGSFLMYGEVQLNKDAGTIIVSQLPIGSAETFCEKLKKANIDGKTPMLGNVEDFSDRNGIHIVVSTKARKKGQTEELLNLLYKYTNLADKLSVNQTLLFGSTPRQVSANTIIANWLEQRVVLLQTMFTQQKQQLLLQSRMLRALYSCVDTDAKRKKLGILLTTSDDVLADLQTKFKLKEDEAKHILTLAIRKITKLDAKDLLLQINALLDKLEKLNALLANEQNVQEYIVNQVNDLAKMFGRPRQCKLVNNAPEYKVVRVAAPKHKSQADIWMEKALSEGAKLDSPIRRRGINRLIKQFYAGQTKFATLNDAWTAEKKSRTRRRNRKSSRMDDSKAIKGKLSYDDCNRLCDEAGVARLGKRAISIARNKGRLQQRLKEHIDYLVKK